MSHQLLYRCAVLSLLAGLAAPALWAQPVLVTARLDTNQINVGGSTTLRILAQVAPVYSSSVDRIFCWCIDVLNTNGTAVLADYDHLVKAASDNDPLVSSKGMGQGSHCLGLYDTFMNSPNAGVASAVELVAIPVAGNAPGLTEFRVQAGTGVPLMSADFIVAPLGGGDALVGGDYAGARAVLEVLATPCEITVGCRLQDRSNPASDLVLTYNLCPGWNHYVEYTANLAGGSWSVLPGGPYNTGQVTIARTTNARFFQIKATR